MNKDDWEELVAQVESHGPEKIEFYLDSADVNGADLPLEVRSLKFEDDEIKVVLE